MQRGERVCVKMLRKHRGFNAGEVCGWPPVQAREMVEAGIAVYTDPPQAKEAASDEPTPAEKPKRRSPRKPREDGAPVAGLVVAVLPDAELVSKG